MTQEHKKVSFMLLMQQSPGEIKRREVSWTLTKKLSEEIKSRRWCSASELDFFCFICFPAAELQTLSL